MGKVKSILKHIFIKNVYSEYGLITEELDMKIIGFGIVALVLFSIPILIKKIHKEME